MKFASKLFATVASLLAPLALAQSTGASFTAEEIKQGYSSRTVLAKPRDGAAASDLTSIESAAGGVKLRRTLRGASGIRVLDVAATESVKETVERLKASGKYDYVEPDYLVKADLAPNDPRYLAGDQWALRNLGQNSGKAGADISAEDAWSIQSSASGVIVAVIDSGMRVTHEEFRNNLWVNPGETGKEFNGVDDDNNGYVDDINGINSIIALNTRGNGAPVDAAGHGTAVASVIAAGGNNSLGMTGVAWSANLMALRFLDASGFGSTSDEIECIDYAIAKKAQIINASFGGSAFSQSLYDALKRARDASIIVVCSAGNDTENNDLVPHYPSSYLLDNIIAVASTSRIDELSSFSDYGAGLIELAAPGSSILCASAATDNGYQTISGTSFSAPMVSGSLALLRAKFPNDTYRATINRLLRSVDVLPLLKGKTATGGRLNLAAALRSTTSRPYNDDFATRGVLTGENITARSAAQGSTREAGEPIHAGTAGNGSLWWSWTAPRSGTVTLDTAGSVTDTLLHVYTGSAVASLTSIASNDDESSSVKTSKLSFTANAGTTYQLAVDNKNNDGGGLVILKVSLLSNNDNFDSAQTVVGRSWNATADNRTATRETDEPRIKNNTGGHSLWYKWVCPADRRYHLSTYTDGFNSMVGVYTGTALSNLAEVSTATSDGDSTLTIIDAGLTFTGKAGTTYYISVDNEAGGTGPTTGSFMVSCIDSEWEAFGSGGIDTVAIAPNGTLHTTAGQGYLYAFNPDGTRKWRYTMIGFSTYSAPAVGADGVVYVGDDANVFYAINPDGTAKWRLSAPGIIQSSPAIAADGTIYIRPEGTRLFALNPNGSTKWSAVVSTSTTSSSASSPIIGSDGTIYCASASSKIVAVNPSDGSIKWTFTTNFINASPAVGPDGTVYVGVYSPTRRLYALNPADGTVKWEYIAGDTINSSPAVGPDGAIYFGCVDKNLYALNSDGTLRWTYLTGGAINYSSPIIASDGAVYIGSSDGKVYCVEPEGTLRRSYATSARVSGSPILNNGRLYIPSEDNRLYAVETGQVPASSNWPMGRQNARRSARVELNTLGFAVQPASVAVAVEEKATFVAGAVGQPPLTYQWYFNGQAIPDATASRYIVSTVYHANGGKYSVKVTDATKATITSNDATLTITTPLVLPTVQSAPVAQTTVNGSGATLSVTASGSAPFTYQWLRDGAPVTGATSSTLVLSNLHPADTANYSVRITNFGGSVTSTPVKVTVNSISRISNLSVLTTLSGKGDEFTLGYVVGGAGTAGSKPLVIRAAGPALGALGVGGTIDDPKIELFAGATKTTENDNWGGGANLSDAFASVGAFPFAGTTSKDAAISTSLTTRDNSVKVSAAGTGSGLVIAEVYDASADAAFVGATPRLVNVSVLKSLGDGLTVGFTIFGSTKTVLIRAIGPTLGDFGVGGVVLDPKMVLFNSTSVKIDENDNWSGAAPVKAAMDAVGAFPLNATSKDAALLATLPPGGYSVQVSGVNNTTGVALVEVYEVP